MTAFEGEREETLMSSMSLMIKEDPGFEKAEFCFRHVDWSQ